MSRTDAHRPWWVDMEWFVPRHWRCQFAPHPYWLRSWDMEARTWEWERSTTPIRVCDLPPEPVLKRDHFGWRLGVGCNWYQGFGINRIGRFHGGFRFPVPNGKENRQAYWYGPDRAAARDWCRDEVKRYRGGVESDPLQPDRVRRDLMPWD